MSDESICTPRRGLVLSPAPRASCELGCELGHEAQGDAHDHSDLVRRHADAREGGQQPLKGLRQIERHRGERDEAHPRHHEQKPAGDQKASEDTLLAYADERPFEVDGAALHDEQVHDRRDHDDEHERGERAQSFPCGNAGEGVGPHHEQRHGNKREKGSRVQGDHDERAPEQKLRARVEHVDGACSRYIASERESAHHKRPRR